MIAPARSRPALWRRSDSDFPASLLDIPQPPRLVWTIGDRALVELPCVAIVGTRRMTAYGERMTVSLASALARAGACIVSGMARGVDATAHQVALKAGAPTIAVLGTGVDVPYPVSHRQLHQEIGHAGLLLSEMEPGQPAFQGCFPRRNRLIAGIARVTIVVEAGHKSGSLITAQAARDTPERECAAVPGPMDAPRSAGCNMLIRDGAHILSCVNDALSLMRLAPEPEDIPPLEPVEQRIWEVLGEVGGAPVELLAARTALSLREVLVAVTSLELGGIAYMDQSGAVRRRS